MSKFTIPQIVVYVCTGSKCGKRGGKDAYKMIRSYTKYSGQDIEVIETECTDRCKFAPVCSIQPANIWLKEYRERDVLKVLQQLTQPDEQGED